MKKHFKKLLVWHTNSFSPLNRITLSRFLLGGAADTMGLKEG